MHKQTKQKLAEWSGLEADKRVDNRESYPGSPSAGKGILEKYQELIEKSLTHVKNPHVLILGSTPETREIILKAGNKLITIDVSQEMIDKTNQLIKTKRDKEEIVIADWLEMPLDDNQFDLIIGDGVYNNITLNNYNKFSLEVARVSKSSAKVIFREAAINPER